ncbi:MAG: tRNA (N6-threonylcarbamoyladenosine(37)-N6)-methyltransferase TrmO [Spirochaetota bacterium]|nr:tRNA (N6-threonylcarbamoyladenosine(37)-N6)-methyltransferase TrmO [Spirochaetota bacterium]
MNLLLKKLIPFERKFTVSDYKIEIEPIGIINSPFRSVADNIPIQGRLKSDAEGIVKIFPEYTEGLKDVEGFSHVFLLYYFHKSPVVKLIARPYMDNERRGVFSIRSPHRPNHIGLTLVELLGVEDSMLKVKGLDIINDTPLLDIKPYNPFFDSVENASIGWMSRFFKDSDSPDIIINDKKEWLHK